MIIQMTMKHMTGAALVRFATYGNGRTAIGLFDPETAEPLCVATVNLPEADLAEDHVFIKDWSENEGVLKSLVDQDLVVDTGGRVPTGYVSAALCLLTEKALAHRDRAD